MTARVTAQATSDRRSLEQNPERSSRSTVSLSPRELAGESAGAAPAGSPALASGSTLKHYEIVRELGRGGMGRVFLARDTRLARLCAIKLLREHTGDGAGRFLAEARATARCRHENIVIVHEIDELRGCPYMVLEHLEGRTLRAWMAERGHEPAPPALAIELVAPVVRALVCAHEMGIVHRDLKPENIFLTEAGPIKVLDFGIAARVDAGDDTGRSPPGSIAGTLPYMAPEQWLGLPIDPRADLWAVGVILFELVAGAHPLAPADPARLAEVRDLGRPMPAVRARRADAGALGDVIDRCLAKDPTARLGSARELLAELEALRPSSGAPARSRPGRRRRAAILAAAAGVVAGIAGVAAELRDPGGAPSGAPAGDREAHATGAAITDVPLPPSSHPEARRAYAAALHGFRDANWALAEEQLRRAVAIDPALAAAHLRLAILLDYTTGRVAEARRSYALAVQGRASLSARDRDLLAAFEPRLVREPPELARFDARLAALARARPDDAEILALHAYFGSGGPEAKLGAARRAVQIDPAYADAWQAVGKQLFVLGRRDEALRAFDACLAVSPAALDCLGERAQVRSALGQCAAAEADLRAGAAASPQSRFWQDLRVSALMAQDKPAEAALEVLAQKWAAQPETRRAMTELHDRARLDLLRGRFDEARDSALALQARARSLPDAELHARYASLLIDLAVEAGRPDDAAAVADDYLRRREAWMGSGNLVDDIAMLVALRDAGRVSAEDFDARRAAWLSRHGELTAGMRDEVWLAAWARPATTPESARAALARAPSGDLRSLVQSAVNHAIVGALLVRAGRAAEAIPFFTRAAHGCDGFLDPVAHVRAAAQLGRVLETTGDRAGACAAYGRVLRRWGAATASSVTARDARLRAAALGCGPASGAG